MELKSSFKLSLIFLLVSAPASMALAECGVCTFNGFTVGLGLGANTFMSNVTSSTELVSFDTIDLPELIEPIGNTYNNYASANVYKFGPMGALFIGYGNVFDNHAYLGGELGLNFLGANETSFRSTPTSVPTITSDDPFGDVFGYATYTASLSTHTKITRNTVEPFLDLKAGFLLTPTALIYLRGGLNYNSFKTKTNTTFNVTGIQEAFERGGEDVVTTASTSAALSSSNKKSNIGFRAGIGGEVMVTPELGVGADYIYSFYRNINTSSSGEAADVSCDTLEGCIVIPGTITNNTKAKLSDQQVMAQLIYHFG